MCPTPDPPELLLRSVPIGLSPKPAISKLSILPGGLGEPATNEAVPELEMSRVAPLPREPLVEAIALLAPPAATAVPAARIPVAAIAARTCQRRRRLDIDLLLWHIRRAEDRRSVLSDLDRLVKCQHSRDDHFAC